MMWQFSGVPEDPENDTMMEKLGAEALYSTVKSVMHAIQREDEDTQQDAVHRLRQIADPSTILRWSESKLAIGQQCSWITKKHALLNDLEWTEDKQATLITLVERYTSRDGSGAWRVHRWWLACY